MTSVKRAPGERFPAPARVVRSFAISLIRNLYLALRGGREGVELHGDAVAHAAGGAPDDPPAGVPPATSALRWEVDRQALTRLHRGVADRRQPAQRQVAERERQVRLLQGRDRVVAAGALDQRLVLLAGED